MSTGYDAVEDKFLKPEKGRKTMMRMTKDVFKRRRDASIFIVSVIITSVSGVLYPLALGFAVNAVLAHNTSLLFLYATLFFLLYFIQFFSNNTRTTSSTRVAQGVIKEMRDGSFQKLQRVPLDFYSKVKTGYLISRIANDSEAISDFLTYQLPQVISGVVTIIIAAAIMFDLNARLTLYSLAVIPLLAVFTFSLQGRVRRNYLRTRRTIAAITGNLAETIAAIRTVKAFNVEERTEGRFEGLNRDNLKANMKATLLSSSYGSVTRVIEAIGIILVIYEGAISLSNGIISLGILVAFIAYVQQFFNPIIQLSQMYNTYQNSMVGASRIYGIVDSEPERDTGDEEKQSFSTSLKGDEVGVAYDDTIALEKVTIEIARGEKVAIVGRTGAGKTTLTNVILKFKLPDGGEVDVDGKDLLDLKTLSYRKLIVPVLQEPFLFNGTIFDNIEYSRPGITKEDVLALIEQYGMMDIYRSLPNGLDSKVGEMGRNLSEGQRQAVSLLRAFIRNPEIIVMDEATGQIDARSESNIIAALRGFSEKRTLILISHKFSLITLADRILVVEKGKIVQQGQLESLSKEPGVFRELYRSSIGSVKGSR